MGEGIINLYREKVKVRWKIGFWVAFWACLAVHSYKFLNTLHNHDSLYNVYTNQNVVRSGRWFLQYACGISSYFDLPWVNGLLCAVYLGLITAVIAELFELDNPVVIGLTGVILSACPATTETLFFGFTADGYFLGLLLASLSALLSTRMDATPVENVLSGTFLCLSLAIYQAYISFAIMLCISYVVKTMLDREMTVKQVWRWIARHVLLYGISAAAYYAVWKTILAFTGQAASDNQGIANVGQGLNLTTVFAGLLTSVRNLLFFFLEWNILDHPITLYAVINIFFGVCFAAVVCRALVSSKAGWKMNAMILFALILSVPLISVWCLVSAEVSYRPMMLHSAVVYYILAMILFDRWFNTKVSTWFAGLIVIMVFNFAVMANIAYFYMEKCEEKSYYLGSQLMEVIEDKIETNSEIEYIAFVGNRAKEVAIAQDFPGSKIHILGEQLESDLLFDHIHSCMYLQEVFGLELPRLSVSEAKDLETEAFVKEMSIWPAEEAVVVFDGVLVIKLAEVTE